jgi:quercetin dioxygenase-like cupin family protein
MTAFTTPGGSYSVLPPGGGSALTVFGNPFWLKLAGTQGHGTMAVIVARFAPGTGALPHLHRGHDEAFYVLDGQFRFRAGDEHIEGGPGSFLYAERDAAHGFDNIGTTEGALLGIIAPAGYEKHFLEISALPAGGDTAEALAEIFARYDQEPARPI